MEMSRIQCGNRAYTPRTVSEREFEGTAFIQLIVDLPSERAVPRTRPEQRTFYLWRPTPGDPWMPMPATEPERIRALGFADAGTLCESEDEQIGHIRDMVLMINEDVVRADA